MAQTVESLVESYFKRATFLMGDIIDTIQNIKLKKYHYLNVFIKKVGAWHTIKYLALSANSVKCQVQIAIDAIYTKWK